MQNTTKRRRRDAGVALPATLFILVVLGLIAGSGFLTSWLELRSGRAHEAGVRAYYAAQSGLAEALATSGLPGATPLSVVLPHGTATVSFETIVDLPGRARLFDIVSTGTVSLAGIDFDRSVRQTVWAAGPPTFDAALTLAAHSATGVTAGSATGYVSGHPPSGCPRPAGAAITTAGPIHTGALAILGAPPVSTPPPGRTTGQRTGLRWADLVDPAVAPPDAVLPADPWPTAGPAWPHIRITTSGPLGPGHSGRGLIVATGDLDLADGFTWVGVILVGGSLRLYGDTDVSGAVLAGLAGQPATVDVGDGQLALGFDPCAAAAATASLAPYPFAVPGTWREEW